MTPIIKRFVIKLLSKDQGSGITKLPGQMQSGFQESIITEKLVRNGYDPRVIKDESELKIILNRIDATKQQSKEQFPTRGYLSTVSPILHFGVGEFKKIDSLEVRWGNGKISIQKQVDVKQSAQNSRSVVVYLRLDPQEQNKDIILALHVINVFVKKRSFESCVG